MSDADLQAMRRAGFTDGQVAEILAHVALNLFTNDVNLAFAVPVDFPTGAAKPRGLTDLQG